MTPERRRVVTSQLSAALTQCVRYGRSTVSTSGNRAPRNAATSPSICARSAVEALP
ncbi:hypothetical protein SAMN04488543_2166 [Friedmanniella luteola]|uniref:Uncharacterized protein n=1 Tax=Friedmanniella luteola TaxID=546871 RepID=A0A1H1U5F2_9ACTN|nr:hypothetical protein SAMN04488543_2166 [Friedmanniella luteola]